MKNTFDQWPLGEAALNSLIEGFQLIGFDWRYLYVNTAVVIQSKCESKEELLGYTMMEKFPGIENTPLFAVLSKCMTERVSQNIENDFKFPDGTDGWFELRVQPVPEGLFILSADITDRKRKELELKTYVQKIEEMMHMTSHRLRQPIAHILGISNLLKMGEHTQLELQKLSGYMQQSAHSLDFFTRELMDFMQLHKISMEENID